MAYVVQQVNFGAQTGLVQDLDALAEKRGTSRAAVIREACRKELQRSELSHE